MPKSPSKAADAVAPPPLAFADLLALAATLAGYPIGVVAPAAPTLPPGLHLTAPAPAMRLPDGRAVPLDLPPDAYPRLYPDLYEVA